MPGVPIFPFERDEVAGVIVVNVFAILSAIALLSIAIRILWLLFLRLFRGSAARSKEYVFFHTQLGYYAACLLIANTINSIAGLMGVPFLVHGALSEDMLCTSQAVTMQFGNVSTAYFTAAIAIHTFNSLVLQRRQSAIVYSTAITVGWVFSGAIATLPLYLPTTAGPIYGVSGLACGVRAAYPTRQFFFHLLPIFISATVSAILYPFIYLVLRGTLVIKGGFKLQLDPNARSNVRLGGYQRFVAGVAKSMLWFPAAYIVFLVPYSVTRLLILSGFFVPFEVMVFAFTCWFTLGVVNVILLYNTFRVLEPAFDGRMSSFVGSVGSKDAEFGGTQSEKANSFGNVKDNRPQLDRVQIPGSRITEVIGYYTQSPVTYPLPVASPTSSLGRGATFPNQQPFYPTRGSSFSSQASHSREGSVVSLLHRSSPQDSRPPSTSRSFDSTPTVEPQWDSPRSAGVPMQYPFVGQGSSPMNPNGPRPLVKGRRDDLSVPPSGYPSTLSNSPPKAGYI